MVCSTSPNSAKTSRWSPTTKSAFRRHRYWRRAQSLSRPAPGHAGISVELIKRLAGRPSRIRHDGTGISSGIENHFVATRYHPLAVERATLPACLKITAESEDGEIMALLTEHGHRLLQNFIQGAKL